MWSSHYQGSSVMWSKVTHLLHPRIQSTPSLDWSVGPLPHTCQLWFRRKRTTEFALEKYLYLSVPSFSMNSFRGGKQNKDSNWVELAKAVGIAQVFGSYPTPQGSQAHSALCLLPQNTRQLRPSMRHPHFPSGCSTGGCQWTEKLPVH